MDSAPCVMVVEDETLARETICETLEDAGCSAIAATDGADAKRQLEAASRPPCVILLDLMMPGMDGWQFRAWQKDDPRFAGVPVVLLSAVRDLRTTATSLGVDYLEKPIAFPALLAAIEKHCGPCDAAGA